MSKKGGKAKEPKETTYEIRDIVLGKIRGYPPWPGMVVDPDGAPPQVQKERPTGKKNTFYCVRFFPAGDYSWLVPKDMSKLQKHEIEAYVNDPHKKSPELLNGYRIALDPEPWEEEKRKAAEAALAQLDQEESDEEPDQDQLASESDGSGSTSKKRKRSASAKSKKAPAKGKGGKKSKPTVESEDDGEGEEDEEVTSKPPPKKAKTVGSKSKSSGKEEETDDPEAIKVKDWRHRLQKIFLSSNKDIKAADMPASDELFTQIENYDKMTIECLQYSKIGKVMRHINSLKDGKIPAQSEAKYRFRERAKLLMDKWQSILNSTSEPHPSSAVNGGENKVNGETLGDMSMMTLPDTTMEVDTVGGNAA